MSIHPILRIAESLLPALLWAALSAPQPAYAHRLYVFAQSDGGQICGESYYSKKIKASGAVFTVQDAPGNILLRGRTDADGRFCFARPSETDILIAVNAEQGHRGEFKLPAKERAAAPPASPALPLPAFLVEGAHDSSVSNDETARQKSLLQSLIREELQRSLPPLLEQGMAAFLREETMRREEREADPSLRDIIGGLGWIAGLGALLTFCRNRRAS